MFCPLPPPPLCSGGFLLIKPILIKFSFIKSEFGNLAWPQSRSPGHEDSRAPGLTLVSLSTSCFQISHTPRPGFILTHAHFISPFSSSRCSTERVCFIKPAQRQKTQISQQENGTSNIAAAAFSLHVPKVEISWMRKKKDLLFLLAGGEAAPIKAKTRSLGSRGSLQPDFNSSPLRSWEPSIVMDCTHGNPETKSAS